MLFVNAGIAHHNQAASIAATATDDFMHVMLAHMRAVMHPAGMI
jgi:hypothetical protein